MGNKGKFLNTTGHSKEGSGGDGADLALRLGLCQEKCINLFLATSGASLLSRISGVMDCRLVILIKRVFLF